MHRGVKLLSMVNIVVLFCRKVFIMIYDDEDDNNNDDNDDDDDSDGTKAKKVFGSYYVLKKYS